MTSASNESPDGAEPPEADPKPKVRRGRWWWWGRWVVLGIVVVYGFTTASNNSIMEVGPLAAGLTSAAIALMLVLVIGGLVWLLARMMEDSSSWTLGRSLLSPLTLIVAFFFVFMAPITRGISAQEEAASNPDPVGMKLAGLSDQITSADEDAFSSRLLTSGRFFRVTLPIVTDYNDKNVTSEDWVRVTRSRLKSASVALRQDHAKTNRIEDSAVRLQWAKQDAARAHLLSALRRLLRSVNGLESGTAALKNLNWALDAARADFRRHWELLRPYSTGQEDLRKLNRLLASESY